MFNYALFGTAIMQYVNCKHCDNVKKTRKKREIWPIPKNLKKKLWYRVVSEPEKLTRKPAKHFNIYFNRKKLMNNHYFLQTLSYKLTKWRERSWQSSISNCSFKKQNFSKVKLTTNFRGNTIDTINWRCLESHLVLSTVSFDVNCSVLKLTCKALNPFF